jgi:hypothetical protein
VPTLADRGCRVKQEVKLVKITMKKRERKINGIKLDGNNTKYQEGKLLVS